MGAAADREALARAATSDEKAFVREAAVTSVARLGGAGALSPSGFEFARANGIANGAIFGA